MLCQITFVVVQKKQSLLEDTCHLAYLWKLPRVLAQDFHCLAPREIQSMDRMTGDWRLRSVKNTGPTFPHENRLLFSASGGKLRQGPGLLDGQ